MSMFDTSQLSNDVLELLNESDQAARAKRWTKLREIYAEDLPLHVRMALLKAWLDESTEADGELIVGLLQSDVPPPILAWLIRDYQTALACLSDLRAESPDKACTLVRVALRLVQPAAAFFYAGARASGYPMAGLKKVAERRKVAFGVDLQRAADDLHIYVPVHLRIQRVEEMNLPCERFGLQPPTKSSSIGTEARIGSLADVSSSSGPETTSSALRSHSSLPATTKKSRRRRTKTVVFYASLMEGLSTSEIFEMAKLPCTDEVCEKLWERTNWKDLLTACLSADVREDQVIDEVPCYSDILYKITIFDREEFSEELRAAIMNAVSD